MVVARPSAFQEVFQAQFSSAPVSSANARASSPSAFASRLKDPAAALAALRSPGSTGANALDVFYQTVTAFADNMGAKNLENLASKLRGFFAEQLKEGAAAVDSEEILAHFTEKYALARETQSLVADYDHIENLLAQDADYKAVSMGVSLLRQQENPQRPYSFTGISYIEAQFHGPVLLDRDVVHVLDQIEAAMPELHANGIEDEAGRDAIIKEILRLKLPSVDRAPAVVRVEALAARALADVNAFAGEVFEKDIEDGAQLMRNAFNGTPPLAGVAKNEVINRINREVSLMKTDLSSGKLPSYDATPEKLAKRLRQKAVQPFIENKARIMQSQAFMKFPTTEERNAFLLWATSAGKLKTSVQFEGVYECSGILTDMLEAKITSGEPLSAQELVDCYKAFYPTCHDYIQEDSKNASEYGPDDRMCFVGRVTSVALSRLRLRVGQEGLASLAAALDTPDARWLYAALQRGVDRRFGYREGTIESATAFMQILHLNLSDEYGFQLHPASDTNAVNYRAIPPHVRAYIAQINHEQAARLEAAFPYDPGNSGARHLTRMPAPANPAAMPQNKDARKEFLLRMLPMYHNHEKTFDKGVNWHGRTHATRSFVFSIAMANILREKGVAIDLNAVALGTAGHDTGRKGNGGDKVEWEAQSADNVNAAMDQLYPDAAGEAWKGQLKANVMAKDENQTTIEGYLLRSADSLDYSRISELDPQYFPFLKTPITTDDGFVVNADESLRTRLMREAKLLSERTDPGTVHVADTKRFLQQMVELDVRGAPPNEKLAVQNLHEQIMDGVRERQIEQTETMTNAQIVEMVENVIRDNPKDFPLLTKYYLNAE